jgi:hypothetical protein
MSHRKVTQTLSRNTEVGPRAGGTAWSVRRRGEDKRFPTGVLMPREEWRFDPSFEFIS